jgi:hypothetical protein
MPARVSGPRKKKLRETQYMAVVIQNGSAPFYETLTVFRFDASNTVHLNQNVA